jgi:hypothetical protein
MISQLYNIPDFYSVIINTLDSTENPRYHDTAVLHCTIKFYNVRLTYLNKLDGKPMYELVVNMSNIAFYAKGDIRIPAPDPFYPSTWDYDETLHVFRCEYETLESAANDTNYWLNHYPEFERNFLQDISGFDSKQYNSSDLLKMIIQIFESASYKFNQLYDSKALQTANFQVLEFEFEQKTFHIAVNNHKPYCACIKDFNTLDLIPQFRNFPLNPSYSLENIAFTFPINILTLPLEKSWLAALNQSELKQIEYWKAMTFGEVIFNKWD